MGVSPACSGFLFDFAATFALLIQRPPERGVALSVIHSESLRLAISLSLLVVGLPVLRYLAGAACLVEPERTTTVVSERAGHALGRSFSYVP